MKFSLAAGTGAALGMFGLSTLAAAQPLAVRDQGSSLGFDNVYDNGSGSLQTVACSDGEHGLLTQGFTTFGSLPNFPNVGGVPAIQGWNSESCGSCWQVSYENKSIYLTGIDVAGDGFVTSEAAMNTLTNGQAGQLGRVDVSYKQVAPSKCGL